MSAPAAPATGGIEYWEARARELGERAVVNLDHPDADDLDAITAGHRAALAPVLAAHLDGSERVVCDLGCGTGRLTAHLAALVDGRAIGVEPVAALRALAPADPRTEFRGLAADGGLPLADGEVDAVVTLTVLGGLSDLELARTSRELRRVLRPGGLLCLAESVSGDAAVGHWTPRTADAYRAALAWAGLAEVAAFDDAGDAISVLVGRAPR